MGKLCVNCGLPFLTMPREHTCSELCHNQYIEKVVKEFGEVKIIVDANTGRRYKVPTRQILEKGIKYSDLPKFPVATDDE